MSICLLLIYYWVAKKTFVGVWLNNSKRELDAHPRGAASYKKLNYRRENSALAMHFVVPR